MAKRRSVSNPSTPLERRVVALAERMGRIAGRMQAAVESLRSARAPVRGKSQMPAAAHARSGGKVDAPGKKHRKAPEQRRGVKHSDQAIAKVTSRKQTRPPRRG